MPSSSAAPQSMTGFASGSLDVPTGRITLELRSVNARFLDLTLRVHDELRAAEPALRELIASRVRRGKIECRVSLQRTQTAGDAALLDSGALERLAKLQAAVQRTLPGATALTVADCLRWPGVLKDDGEAAETLVRSVLALAARVSDEFVTTRLREGESCQAAVRSAVDAIDAIVRNLSVRTPALVTAQQQRLSQRLQDALAAAGAALATDETAARVRQEISAYGLRADVAEELARLGAHVAEARRSLDAGGPVGKRLDFLAQEFNREANTLGSKAVVLELTQASVELKLLIEQIREQAQNLE